MTHETVALTPGYLPVGPFLHDGPTDVAELRLEGPAELLAPGEPLSAQRDALVLVRLHGDPLGFVHLDLGAPREGAALLENVAAKLVDEIHAHVVRHGCSGGDPDLPLFELDAACVAGLPDRTYSDLAIIIPTTRGGEQLRRCLHSFLRTGQGDLEIVVVDNAPDTERTKPVVAEMGEMMPRLRYVAESRPGSSVARNRGIRETQAELLVFTDDDVVVDSGWVSWLVAPFADPDVWAVTGLVLPLDLSSPAHKLFERYAGFAKGVDARRYDRRRNRADDRILFPYWGGVFGSGNSMAFRRSRLVELDGFDPALGAGSPALAGADIELFSRVIARGGCLVYEPRSICWHEHRPSMAAFERQLYNYGAGLTAIFTKSLLTDRGFLVAGLRSLPIVAARLRPGRDGTVQRDGALPERYAQLQRRGMRQGPRLYFRSRYWVAQLGLESVISD